MEKGTNWRLATLIALDNGGNRLGNKEEGNDGEN
jgi:hypothetical protein